MATLFSVLWKLGLVRQLDLAPFFFFLRFKNMLEKDYCDNGL